MNTNKFNKIIRANKSLIVGISIGVGVIATIGAGVGISMNVHHKHQIENVEKIVAANVAVEANYITYLKNQQNKISQEQIKFNILSKKISDDKNIVDTMAVLDPQHSVKSLQLEVNKSLSNINAGISEFYNAIKIVDRFKELDAAKKAGKKIDEDEFDRLVDILGNDDGNVSKALKTLSDYSKKNTNLSLALSNISNELINSGESAKKYYTEMVSQVNDGLKNKTYNFDEKEHQFTANALHDQEEMKKGIEHSRVEALEEIRKQSMSALKELDNNKSKMDSDDYESSRREISNEIAKITAEINKELNQYDKDADDYANYAKQDINHDKQQVQQMVITDNRSHWSFADYYLLSHWLNTPTTTTHVIHTTVPSYSGNYGSSRVIATSTNQSYDRLYGVNSYQSGYKSKVLNGNLKYNNTSGLKNSLGTIHQPMKIKVPDVSRLSSLHTGAIKVGGEKMSQIKSAISSRVSSKISAVKTKVASTQAAKISARSARISSAKISSSRVGGGFRGGRVG